MKYVVAVTGASGSVLAKKLVEAMCSMGVEIVVVASDNGAKVFDYEIGKTLESFLSEKAVELRKNDDMFADIASGSNEISGMIIIPCSMSTVAKIANGISDTLLLRAADVTIKEERKLVIVPRESPLSKIHLNNLLTVSQCGGTIIPPVPQFYNKPQTVDDIVNGIIGRVLKSCGIDNKYYMRWGQNL